MRVGLVACSKRKWHLPTRARDLYQGTLFKWAARYIEKNCDDWGILSTRYGLVMPDQLIAPYEETLSQKTAAQRRAWEQWVFLQLMNHWGGGATYVVIAGRPYRAALVGLKVEVPLGLDRVTNGLQVKRLMEALR